MPCFQLPRGPCPNFPFPHDSRCSACAFRSFSLRFHAEFEQLSSFAPVFSLLALLAAPIARVCGANVFLLCGAGLTVLLFRIVALILPIASADLDSNGERKPVRGGSAWGVPPAARSCLCQTNVLPAHSAKRCSLVVQYVCCFTRCCAACSAYALPLVLLFHVRCVRIDRYCSALWFVPSSLEYSVVDLSCLVLTDFPSRTSSCSWRCSFIIALIR